MKITPELRRMINLIENEVDYYRDYLYRNGGGHYDNFGGFDYDDPRWKRLSSKLIRKIGRCQICGASDMLEVHHTIPVKHDLSLAFDVKNLLVVCKDCHRDIHERYNEVLYDYVRYSNEDSVMGWNTCKRCGVHFWGRRHWELCPSCWGDENGR